MKKHMLIGDPGGWAHQPAFECLAALPVSVVQQTSTVRADARRRQARQSH